MPFASCMTLTEGPAKNHPAGRAKLNLAWARIVLWESFEAVNILHSGLPKSLQVVPKNLISAGRKPSRDHVAPK